MVRLKSDAVDEINDITSFQFHYGSIKINPTVLVGMSMTKFQFHYGSIKIKKIFKSQ